MIRHAGTHFIHNTTQHIITIKIKKSAHLVNVNHKAFVTVAYVSIISELPRSLAQSPVGHIPVGCVVSRINTHAVVPATDYGNTAKSSAAD